MEIEEKIYALYKKFDFVFKSCPVLMFQHSKDLAAFITEILLILYDYYSSDEKIAFAIRPTEKIWQKDANTFSNDSLFYCESSTTLKCIIMQ